MNLSAVINLQLVMFALFICGFILTRKGVINSERRKGMSDLLIDLFLPANIICAFLTGISRDVFAEAFQVLVIALGIQIISYLLGLVLYRKEVNGRRMVLRYATICSNAGFMGMFNLIFSLAALYLLIFRWSTTTVPYRCLLVVCALIFTVWQPFLLWNKARKQAKRPAVKNPMRLIFDDEKLTVSQEENSADFTWEQMGRLDAKSSMYILYMDRVHAYLIPKETLGEQEETFRELVTAHLPKERRRKI